MEFLKPGAAIEATLARQAEQLQRPFPTRQFAESRQVRTTTIAEASQPVARARQSGGQVVATLVERRLNRNLADQNTNSLIDQDITNKQASQRIDNRRVAEQKLDDLQQVARRQQLTEHQQLIDQQRQLESRIADRNATALADDSRLKADLRHLDRSLESNAPNTTLPRGSIIDIRA